MLSRRTGNTIPYHTALRTNTATHAVPESIQRTYTTSYNTYYVCCTRDHTMYTYTTSYIKQHSTYTILYNVHIQHCTTLHMQRERRHNVHIHHIIHQTTHSTYTVSYIKQPTAHTVKCQGVPDEASVEPASQKQGCQGSGPLALQTLRRTQSSGCLWQTACVRVCVFVRVFVRARVRACIHVRNTRPRQ